MGIILRNKPNTIAKRRVLRKNSPTPEQRLWYFLRNRNICNTKFRRQYAVGPYILDFYASEMQLGIEIDGDSHFTERAQEYDSNRTEYLNDCGLHIIRFTNKEIMEKIDSVLESIRIFIISQNPSPLA
ncbi:MAG: hypothetical protein A3C02_03390 [Candidatus Andersenbacteria bacterium RIFCSPHIGHO2_02_FULL_45_11]|uniref:DUF559 domain-containing protein n=1 Tax=Candidatus Andersenbacteria bacterium RIFCSPHIGHO2_12_FULL_45_11 TaxID=1797281 RepID=A0A1G1X476_9BACT|nr:MAG: hypothetical protein A2805_03805 [Candidatus Andersenbacteria bacterium RIFCSPHIGHO2_01_FULL_46_36]OGY33481.1 MAG: hypothetical protein A3C02_03390 [Candidatus Andersenbacteria bacterium RIFCSPHIGHO2_02_FULL_45_11]OGY34826.1 MAG: hypothetical protein A3D99_02870 [Candidatus Andersenbacteria bacterium RIFCSPHIGHO2_12_FULL_45_11]